MIVRAAVAPQHAARRYNLLSYVYDLNAVLGAFTGRAAMEIAAIREGEVVLELGAGTGRDLIGLAHRVGEAGLVFGLDFAVKMLLRTQRRVEAAGYRARVRLVLCDARTIPFANAAFDAVFSSRLLDLIDTPEIPGILAECRRVLKPSLSLST